LSSRFHLRKSWGAEPVEGGARFRIWAPSQSKMALRVAASGRDLPMAEAGEGWFEIETDAVAPGQGYAFVLADGRPVNDPAARAQVSGVHGPSRLVDPAGYEWHTADWRGRPWEETVIYELHTGAFSPEGTFDGPRRRLDHLAETGITAIELMPVAEFGGDRGWGYDGVLLYAPHRAYGGPEGLKQLIDAAHERELMVFLDVVYNHFGPEGNYLHLYAPDFFHPERKTPWGSAIAYDKPPVRAFFVENALYWLEEYRFDGLRLDAIDQIDHQSEEPLLEDLARTVRERITERHVHLATEDDRNITKLHERDEAGRVRLYSGEWNDDFHHAAHVAATGERDGYYQDYAEDPVGMLAHALATGFIYQGETSGFRDGGRRGVQSSHLPPAAFVNFLQNHDQIGNRAFNERLTALADTAMVEALTAILLLSPQIPLLFMGEEWGETRPFGFFTDFHGELGDLVREGRRREFAKWRHFSSEESRKRIADPNEEATFLAAKLDWDELSQREHQACLELVRRLLEVRRREIVPLIPRIGGNAGSATRLGDKAFAVAWRTRDEAALSLYANLGEAPLRLQRANSGRLLFAHGGGAEASFRDGTLSPLSVIACIEEGTHFVPLPI
jgi:malto-oligosyltrehalose trehalohydrolase